MRILRLIAVVLAIVSIGILCYDYCDGHLDEGLFHTEFCPICASYMSAELTPVFSFDTVRPARLVLYHDQIIPDGSYHVKPLTHLVTRRGPPVQAVFMHV